MFPWDFFGLFGFTFIPILWLLSLILVVWAIIDIVEHKEFTDIEKLIWVLVVVFLNIIGVIIYYFAGRTKAIDLEKIMSEVAPKTQYCPYCGRRLPEGVNYYYCPYCGMGIKNEVKNKK